MRFQPVLIFCLALLTSCVSEIEFSLPKTTPRIVVEALLTDEIVVGIEGSYSPMAAGKYVRLSFSDPVNTNHSEVDNGNNIKPVRDALITVRDDLGQIDTLKADSATWESFHGYYTSPALKCEAGRTYFLDVWVGKDHYYSSAYMPKVSKMDSVSVVYIKRPIDKFSGYGPLIYFKNNSRERDYYLTKVVLEPMRETNGNLIFSNFNSEIGSSTWNFAVLSDAFLPEQVQGLSIPLGATPSTYYVQSLNPGATYEACLFSLTKEAYDYYDALIKSLRNDGGAYTPTPSSPPSNIKGGALGFFNASAASTKRFKVPE